MPTILMKKLAGLPTLYCLQAISLIETFSLIAIWPEQIILQPAQHYIARDGENSYSLGLDQQCSPGCKKGHYKGKNAKGTSIKS
jgi:hypothetical protein